MWYSSFGIRPGSQYDAGTMNVTSIMSIAEAICMFLVKMQLLMYKILTTWWVGCWKHFAYDTGIEISYISTSLSRHTQRNTGAGVMLWTRSYIVQSHDMFTEWQSTCILVENYSRNIGVHVAAGEPFVLCRILWNLLQHKLSIILANIN